MAKFGVSLDKCFIFFTNSMQDSTKTNKIPVISYSEQIGNILELKSVPHGYLQPFIAQLQTENKRLESRVEYLEQKMIKIIEVINKKKEKNSK